MKVASTWTVGEYTFEGTGSRRAGGCGVDTAAGWFMRMIGAESDIAEE